MSSSAGIRRYSGVTDGVTCAVKQEQRPSDRHFLEGWQPGCLAGVDCPVQTLVPTDQRGPEGPPPGPSQVWSAEGRVGRGISPRAGHRSVRDCLPSHGSCRPRELPPPRQRPAGSSCCQLAHYGLGVDDLPLHSTDMTPLHRDDEVVRPLVSHPYSRPRGSIHCWLLRLHRHRRWFGSHSCKSVRGAPSLISFTVTQNIKPFRVSRFARGTARK